MPTDHDIPKLIINKLTQAQYDAAVKNADELYLTPDSGGLPDQTGQSGKYLTTDGTTASWGAVSIPTVNNSTITIQKNSTTVDSFTLNQSSNKTIDIIVPTKVSDLTNDSGFITGITANNVTTALGYTPYNSSNPSGYITGITANNVTTALGYTPYNSTNPNGYTSNTGTVTSVQVQAGTGLTSSQSSAQTTTLNTTIGIDSSYKLPTTAEFSAKEDVPTEVSESSASVTLNIVANTNYDLTNVAITDITLSSCESSSLESTITFSTGATAPTLTDNSGISWINGSAPILNTNMSYIILIWKKKGFVKEY